MMTPTKWLVSAMLACVAVGGVVPAASAATAPAERPAIVTLELAAARDCQAKNNHDEVVAKFISRCKKGSIRSRISSDRLSRTLGEVYAGKQRGDRDDVTAWKLLNSREYDK